MAIYSLSVSCVKRSEGGSALAAAAYLEDRLMYDVRLDRDFRYGSDRTRKHETTICLGSRLPDGTAIDTQRLWNAAEQAETRVNARTARRIMIALPVELSQEKQIEAIESFRRDLEKTYHVATTAAIHYEHEHNPHCHLMITTREISQEGDKLFFGAKTRSLDDKKTGSQEIERIRESWELTCNRQLEMAHEKVRIDRRSYERQGIDVSPQIHLGLRSRALERKGLYSERIERAVRIWEIRETERRLKHERRQYAYELDRIERHTLKDRKFEERLDQARTRTSKRDESAIRQPEINLTESGRTVDAGRGSRKRTITDFIETRRTGTQDREAGRKTISEILAGLDKARENKEIKTASQLLEESRARTPSQRPSRGYSLDLGDF